MSENVKVVWTPNDFSPTYEFEVNRITGDFVRLLGVFDLPEGYPERRQVTGNGYRTYLVGDGWSKIIQSPEYRAALSQEGTDA